MRDNERRIIETPWEQGADEIRAYSLTTTPWGSSPSSPVVKLYEMPALTDVTDTKMSGAASASGDVITTPTISGLVAGIDYRIEIKFVIDGRTEEAWGIIKGRR